MKITGMSHVALEAKDPAALAEFYRDVLGIPITGGSSSDNPLGASTFLSTRHDEEDHELVFFANPVFKHIAFRVAALADLRGCHRQIKERGIPIKLMFNHGCSLSFYFDDPEGNMIEVYWATGLHNWQPYADPIDLDAPEEELIQAVARVAAEAGLPVPAALGEQVPAVAPISTTGMSRI